MKIVTHWPVIDDLATIILAKTSGCVVEIGMGHSTCILARHAQNFRRHMYSCDKDPNFEKWYCYSGHRIFIGSDKDFMNQFEDTPSLVFLDGPHDYDSVIMEAKFFLERMTINGVLFIHDTYPPSEEHLRLTACGDAYRVRQELEKMEDIQVFTWPHSIIGSGLTMALKEEKNRPFYQR